MLLMVLSAQSEVRFCKSWLPAKQSRMLSVTRMLLVGRRMTQRVLSPRVRFLYCLGRFSSCRARHSRAVIKCGRGEGTGMPT